MNSMHIIDGSMSAEEENKEREKATFAGGCFWCLQQPFDELEGVVSTAVGYIGGHKEDPTYEEVCGGSTGHAEAIEILFDPSRISYSKLLDLFWKNIDPTTLNRQFADVGTQYRTSIFYHNDEQRHLAEASKVAMEESGRYDKLIITEITAATTFYKAEEYHQKYYAKCPVRYQSYKSGSGRELYLKETWKTDS